MPYSSFAAHSRRSLLVIVVAMSALSRESRAQGRGRGGPPVGTFDVVWRPVRDGTPDVTAIEVKETARRDVCRAFSGERR
jgi:hypothetical protein